MVHFLVHPLLSPSDEYHINFTTFLNHYLLVYFSLSPGDTASSMVSRALSTSDEVVVIAGAAPMLPTELRGTRDG